MSSPLGRPHSAPQTLSASGFQALAGFGIIQWASLLKHRVPGSAPQFLDSVSLRWDLRICIAKKFPDDTDAAGPLFHINLCHTTSDIISSFLMSLTTLLIIQTIGCIYCVVTFHTPTTPPQNAHTLLNE